jgi:hypothetical protein
LSSPSVTTGRATQVPGALVTKLTP